MNSTDGNGRPVPVTLSALVGAYNVQHGASLRVRGMNVLLLPSEMIRKFFHAAISKTIAHVKELLAVSPVLACEKK